ncbi:MAG: CoB--CoM heterodisulfide reductase iron-sulfur subunit B family protein [Dehalococcoidia bacterium]|nr:CoB--CoM heterodisulfide reductase iron-sulfur subunit B family protein [Dehalococcoidia bacterium]
MKYSYMPGCSLLSTARGYDTSARAVVRELGSELIELDDWNCCGANAIESVSYLLSLALPARNLALAEQANRELVTGCSSCFFNLFKINHCLRQEPALQGKLDEILAAAGLRYSATCRVRHLMDVIANDIGVKAVTNRVERKLTGLKVVPYYGCQIVRPSDEYNGPYLPAALDKLIVAVGAEPVPYLWKTRCCGGVLMTTEKAVGVNLAAEILAAAQSADCIVTVCPTCQMNLDAYQSEISVELGVRIRMPVLFLTQLLGLAFGLTEKDLLLDLNIVPVSGALRQLQKI